MLRVWVFFLFCVFSGVYGYITPHVSFATIGMLCSKRCLYTPSAEPTQVAHHYTLSYDASLACASVNVNIFLFFGCCTYNATRASFRSRYLIVYSNNKYLSRTQHCSFKDTILLR